MKNPWSIDELGEVLSPEIPWEVSVVLDLRNARTLKVTHVTAVYPEFVKSVAEHLHSERSASQVD